MCKGWSHMHAKRDSWQGYIDTYVRTCQIRIDWICNGTAAFKKEPLYHTRIKLLQEAGKFSNKGRTYMIESSLRKRTATSTKWLYFFRREILFFEKRKSRTRRWKFIGQRNEFSLKECCKQWTNDSCGTDSCKTLRFEGI